MGEPIRVLRVIARMNVGGPAHHVSILGGRLDRRGYHTLLVAGRVGPGEASAEHLAAKRGARLVTLEALSPEIRPLGDVGAFFALVRLIRAFRPAIVHTHTAKAGFLARTAALLSRRPRPVIVHTYHGHVLSGYFGRPVTAIYRNLERLCARFSDALVGVSQSTVDDLVRFGIASPEKFWVIPLGLELEALLALEERPSPDARLRVAAGAGADDVVVAIVGRLVAIKRIDRALESFAAAQSVTPNLRLLVVGDGELRAALEARARELRVEDTVHFAGFQSDMREVVAAADVALLTSDNEGTPVALIEAAAGARPAVTTHVGGVGAVVSPTTGRLCDVNDVSAIASALSELARDDSLRVELGRAARTHVRQGFGADRLVDDIDALYRHLLARAR